MYKRGNYHANIQKKLMRLGMCVEVRMVASGLTESEAFALEIERIAFWRSVGVKLANKTDGGEGTSNPPPETRALMRAAKLGRKLSEDHKSKIGAASKISNADPDVKARRSASLKKTFSDPARKAAMSKRFKEMPRTKEHYEKVAAALRGRPLSPEHIESMRIAHSGKKQSSETIEKRVEKLRGQKRSPEFCARMKAAWTPERRAAQAEKAKALWNPEFTERQRKRVNAAPKDARGKMLPHSNLYKEIK